MTIKTARKAAGLTLSQLSGLTGINIRQIQKYESGEYKVENMTLKTALAISSSLKITPEELIEMKGRD